MKKIKENLALKIVASIILSLCGIVGFLSGIMVVAAIRSDYYNPGGKENLKNDILQEIIDANYEYRALDWYCNMEFSGVYDHSYEDYKHIFSEENTNYFFTAEVIEEDGKDEYGTLSNYQTEDYQYKKENIHDFIKSEENVVFTYPLSIERIEEFGEVTYYDYYDSQYETNTEYYDEYYEDITAAAPGENYEENEIIYQYEVYTDMEVGDDYSYIGTPDDGYVHYDIVTNLAEEEEANNEEGGVWTYGVRSTSTYEDADGIHVALEHDDYRVEYTVNESFKKEYDEFIEQISSKYDNNCLALRYYNAEDQTLYIEYEVWDVMPIKITSYVKSELTAHDAFYSSAMLQYFVPIANAALPVFIITCVIALLMFVYIVVAAGHKKGVDGIYLNGFHRVPYDLLVGMYLGAGVLTVCLIEELYWYMISNGIPDFVGCAIVGTPFVFAFPALIYSTVARIKAGNLFVNTVAWRVLKFVGRILKKLLVKFKVCAKEMRNYLNLYIKWIGAYGIISIIQLILCCNVYDFGFTLIIWGLEKIALAVLLVLAIVNMNKLKKGGESLANGRTDYEIDTENMLWEFKKHGDNLNQIKDGIQVAVDERMKSEKMKTELITNVSHDIKTPLTSIANYVDLLSKEELNNEKAVEYLEVLERQSGKLKKLIQDLIDASKASTGNMPVNVEKMDIKVLLEQVLGEATERFEAKGIKPVVNYRTEETCVMADGKHLWRVFDNLVNNILKYGQDNTRVYVDVESFNKAISQEEGLGLSLMLKVEIKNISKEELNINGDELMERFVRGDSSRNTEGSGLGLSIAKSLMEIQGGSLEILVDGDLFKVVLLLMRV